MKSFKEMLVESKQEYWYVVTDNPAGGYSFFYGPVDSEDKANIFIEYLKETYPDWADTAYTTEGKRPIVVSKNPKFEKWLKRRKK